MPQGLKGPILWVGIETAYRGTSNGCVLRPWSMPKGTVASGPETAN